jgi:hypothetical protein
MSEDLTYTPPILRLPIELRETIYDQLLELKNTNQGTHPLPGVGITSVSLAPPSSDLLVLHPTITSELLDRFYSQATCKTVISHAFNFFWNPLSRSNVCNVLSWSSSRIFCS